MTLPADRRRQRERDRRAAVQAHIAARAAANDAARAQLAAVTAQRDELMRVAVALADVCDRMDKLSDAMLESPDIADIEFDRLEHEFYARVGEVTGTARRIARAQPEQPKPAGGAT